MATVKLLLNESIKSVGRVGDVVNVSPGYARNYLLPHGLAVEPTAANLKRVEARRKEIERVERERREQQQALLKQLEGIEVTLERKTNERGHLYGAVSATDIAKALQAQGFNVRADDINLPGRMDQVNTYMVRIRFAEDLETEVKAWIAPDAESKAAIEEYRKTSQAETPPASNSENNG